MDVSPLEFHQFSENCVLLLLWRLGNLFFLLLNDFLNLAISLNFAISIDGLGRFSDVFFCGELGLDELSVKSAFADELVVPAAFAERPLAEDVDAVGVADGREAVGDHDRGDAVGLEALERLLDLALVLAVEGRGGLVEDEHLRLLAERPRDGDPLLLAARELRAAAPHVSVEPLLGLLDELPGVGLLERLDHLLLGERRVGQPQVLGDRHREQDGLLADEADLAAVVVHVHLGHLGAVDEHGALLRVVVPQQQLHDRALAAPRLAHQRAHLTLWKDNADMLKDRLIILVRKTNVLKPDSLDVLDLNSVFRLIECLLSVKKVQKLSHAYSTFGYILEKRRNLANGRSSDNETEESAQDISDIVLSCINVVDD